MLKALFATLLYVAASLASAAPAVLTTARMNDGTEADTAVVGTRIPLVLVHGLGGSTNGWDNFLHAYAANPSWQAVFKPYAFSYSSSASEVNADPAAPRTITGLGAAFRDALQGFYDKPAAAPDFGFGGKSIVVLAHSMGGLVSRSMMQEYAFRDGRRGGERVLHLITLGTPHQGSQLADAGFSLGLLMVSEFSDAYTGFVSDMTWTNFDGLNMSSGRCNGWLSRLNNYAPSAGADQGRCGAVAAHPLPGFYERIIAYGARTLQQPDPPSGSLGVFKPGSANSMLIPYSYLYSGLSRSYSNDGVVPMASAQFNGPAIWSRREAFDCDHRYLQRGYPEVVRSATATYSDWAFCAATGGSAGYASGTSGGWAVSGSIFGAPGGIVDTVKTVSEVERVFDWAEQAYAPYLAPAGAVSGIWEGYYYRYYPTTGAYAGVKAGEVYYQGPASGNQVLRMGTLAEFLSRTQAAGF